MARETSEDPANSLPDPALLGRYDGDLQLYCPDIAALPTEERIAWARRAEEAAMAADKRIRNSEGSWYESNVGTKVYASSAGFVGSYRGSYCSVAVSPIAQAEPGHSMERDYWYSVARSVAALEPAEAVGRKAAERAVRRLGARKVSTRQVPVVFDPETASSLVGHIFGAVRGDAIYRKASFLTDKLGQKVAGENVTVLDDGLRPGGFGSRPFDDEGIPASTTTVIERGVLKKLPAEFLRGKQAGHEDHRQRNARAGWSAQRRSQKPLLETRHGFAGRNHPLGQGRLLCDGVDRVWGKRGDRRLLARRRRIVD